MLKIVLNEIRNGILCTSSRKEDFPDVEYLEIKEIDQNDDINSLLSTASKSYCNLLANNNIKLIYTMPQTSELLQIIGTAEISKNSCDIEKYWSLKDLRNFDQGINDPRIRVLKIAIGYSQCLKSNSNSMIEILKLLGRTIGRRDH